VKAIVYAFAIQPGLDDVPGAAPLPVLSRQLPRLLVAALNGDRDRGARFFPLLGLAGRRRSFFTTDHILSEAVARRLHRQQDVSWFVHGCLHGDAAKLVVYDSGGSEVYAGELPFDPRSPLPFVALAAYEVGGILGLQASLRPPGLDGAALAAWLAARDALLALEANLLDVDVEAAVRQAQAALRHRPQDPQTRELFVQLCARAVALQPEALWIGDAVHEALAFAGDDEFHALALPLLAACRHPAVADLWLLRIAHDPGRADYVLRAASALRAVGRHDDLRAMLESAVARGCDDATVLAQLATARGKAGDRDGSDALMHRLRGRELPSAAVAVLFAGWLTDHGESAPALVVLEQALAREPAHSGLLLEQARAYLERGDGEAARRALVRCLQSEPPPAMRADAERLLRFCARPQALRAVLQLDRRLQAGELRAARALGRALVRQAADFAEAWLFYGTVQARLGHNWRAARSLRRALRLMPELGEAHNRLGILLVGRGRLEEGYHHLLQAVHLLPLDSAPQLHLAQACRLLGRADEGRAALAAAERLGAAPALLARVRALFGGDDAGQPG
jgi:tetratricopeptide (TPR) repeat protein